MRRMRIILSLLVAMIALPLGALAREVVPVVEYNDVAVATASGSPVTAEQVRNAIMAAAATNRWEVVSTPAQNALFATLNVHGKHTVVVSIPYSAEKFSIKYQSSINMKYRLAESAPAETSDLSRFNTPAQNVPAGTPLIHPYYNRWVQNLLQSIHAELRKL